MRVVKADAEGLEAAEAALLGGQPVVLPTDTVYGLAVMATDTAGLERVFDLKSRPKSRSVAILVADRAQAEQLGDFELAGPLADRHWPGALTLVVDRLAHVNASVGHPDGTVGIRCPDSWFVRELARRVGPLATTSANRSGQPTPELAIDAAESLAGSVVVTVDAGPCSGDPSTVARVNDDGTVHVFRQGTVSC